MPPLPQPAASFAPGPTFSFAAFAIVADRLEAVLDFETEALTRNRACDLTDTCGRKRQGLLELSRFLPSLATAQEREGARSRLGRLEQKIEHNRQALDVQIGAVREVADIIASSMRDAESDGTYSASVWRS